MNTQNILKFYGSKLDVKLDMSEYYDFKLETDNYVDILIDNSEFYDFKLEIEHVPDIILDYSEYYDFELGNTLSDYDLEAILIYAQNALLFEDASIVITEDGVTIIY